MSLLRNSVASLFGRSSQSKRRENIVAIDLGAEHTKAVYLQRKSDRCLLAGYARLDWARHWSGMLTLAHYARKSTSAGQDADQNAITLTISYNNR